MLKIAICDDDLGFTGSLETMVLEESRSIGIRVDTNVFSDGKTLLKSIQSGERYGLIFIDILKWNRLTVFLPHGKSVRQIVQCCLYIFQDMTNI